VRVSVLLLSWASGFDSDFLYSPVGSDFSVGSDFDFGLRDLSLERCS
jgi:hypothetical protein